MKIPRFTKKDMLILSTLLPAIVVFNNMMLFGVRFFLDIRIFILSGLLIAIINLAGWLSFTWIAVTIRNKFPRNKDSLKRICLTMTIIIIAQAFINSLYFLGYDYLNLFGYTLNATNYTITIVIFIFINILVTIVHEGFEGFEKWKASLNEADKLKTTYAKSRLLSLKSHINPHFLFNSINSLSSLLDEDPHKADHFLKELTEIYRYYLSNFDEPLVELKSEINFLKSYFFLLKTRYGKALDLQINFKETDSTEFIPPLSLQVLTEDILIHNQVLKESPLCIMITHETAGRLAIKHNIQKKVLSVPIINERIHILSEKLMLITEKAIQTEDKENYRLITFPLISQKRTTK